MIECKWHDHTYYINVNVNINMHDMTDKESCIPGIIHSSESIIISTDVNKHVSGNLLQKVQQYIC